MEQNNISLLPHPKLQDFISSKEQDLPHTLTKGIYKNHKTWWWWKKSVVKMKTTCPPFPSLQRCHVFTPLSIKGTEKLYWKRNKCLFFLIYLSFKVLKSISFSHSKKYISIYTTLVFTFMLIIKAQFQALWCCCVTKMEGQKFFSLLLTSLRKSINLWTSSPVERSTKSFGSR